MAIELGYGPGSGFYTTVMPQDGNQYMYDAQGNRNYIPLEYSNSTLWKYIPKEKDTNLECGRWYLIEIIAFDNEGFYDYIETSYQKDL